MEKSRSEQTIDKLRELAQQAAADMGYPLADDFEEQLQEYRKYLDKEVSLQCPRCGAILNVNVKGDVWCTGNLKTVPIIPCFYGIEEPKCVFDVKLPTPYRAKESQ